METLKDTSVTHHPLSNWKEQGHVHGCSGWFIFCYLGELNLSLIILMEHTTLLSRANVLQSFIRSWELNCQLALTQPLYLLSAMTERRRRRKRREELLLRGASAARVAPQKCFSHHADLREGSRECLHRRAAAVPSCQNKSVMSPCSDPQWHHLQEGKPRPARWRHLMCVTDVCITCSDVPLLQFCSLAWSVCVNGLYCSATFVAKYC